MFWDTKDPPSHNIEILLESPDTKVELFLEEDNIIQECKTLNKNIVNYFTRPDVVRRMIELITTEPPEEVPISERFRHANVACEILTMGLPSLDEKLLADTNTLNMLYSYLENEPPLNPLLASFFSKTFSMLFTRKSEQDWFLYQQTCLKLLEYLKTKSNFLDLICKHFTTPIVPDLIMEIMQNVEGVQLKKSLFEWLNEERLIEKLIEIIGDPEQSEKHANVADFLCDLIHQGRTMRQDTDSFEPVFDGSDPVLQKIESAATLLALFNVILQPNAGESAIVSGITVVLTIIKPAKVIDERNLERMRTFADREKDFHYEFLPTVIRVIEPQLKHFTDLLKNPPKKPDILTSAANLSPPFGMARLQIVRLFTELLETKNKEISDAISETDFLDILLSLFKEYCWNNFLHNEVEKCLRYIFSYYFEPPNNNTQEDVKFPWLCGPTEPEEEKEEKEEKEEEIPPSAIQTKAIVNCKLISKLLECWKINKEKESVGKGRRLGYMGHLIKIFKHIRSFISDMKHLAALIESNFIDDNERNFWQSIVHETDGELTDILSTQSKLLANHEHECEYNVSLDLDFSNVNNMTEAFNDFCNLMDSADADVIFTLDYNAQHDDHEFDDDDVDDDYNSISNDNNEGSEKDQRNDDVKNTLNLFQFGHSNDDDDAEEDDNAAAPFDGDGDGGLSFFVKPKRTFFPEVHLEENEIDDMLRGIFLNFEPTPFSEARSVDADFETQIFSNPSTSSRNDVLNTATETAAVTTTSSEEFDNNANVEKASSWIEEFTSFQIPQKDIQFTTNFVDDYEDDEGMWTKPLGVFASTTTVKQSETQSVDPANPTDECKTHLITNGPSMLEESEHGPEEATLNQLSNSIEDNTLIDQAVEDITLNEKKDETIEETNNELNIKQEEKEEEEVETTPKHKSHKLDTKNTETENVITTTTNTNTNHLTNAATAVENISDGSTTAT